MDTRQVRLHIKTGIFFIKKLKFSYEQAVTGCLQVWANSYEGESPSKIINKMTEANIEFEEKMINELLELLDGGT